MGQIQSRLDVLKTTVLANAYRRLDPIVGESAANARERVTASMDGDATVGFLCFGNICRSPFAERYFRRTIGLDALSAGFFPEEGRKSPDPAIEAADRFGIDLSSHRSTSVDRRTVERADVIFLMDFRNVVEYERTFGRTGVEPVLLGRVANSGNPSITDPYGESVDGFLETYRQIVDAIRTIEGAITSS